MPKWPFVYLCVLYNGDLPPADAPTCGRFNSDAACQVAGFSLTRTGKFLRYTCLIVDRERGR